MSIAFLQLAKDATDLTTYTFSSQSLGAAASDRYIICAICGRSNDGSARTISSVTIGGVTATINAQVENTGTMCGIATALVPTGTTGDVVVVWSGTMGDANIALYRTTNLTSATALDTGTSTANPGTTNLDTKTGSVIVAISENDNGALTATWTNLTENYDEATATGNDLSGAFAEITESPNVSVTGNLTVTCQWSSAPTRPVFAAASFAVNETLAPLSAVVTVIAPSITGGATVSLTVIDLTANVIAPTVSLPTPDWTTTNKSSPGTWTNTSKS